MVAIILFGLTAVLSEPDVETPEVASRIVPSPDSLGPSAATGGTGMPDIEGSVAGDERIGQLDLRTADDLPDIARLDFLFEFCFAEPCFRDAHFMDPSHPGYGSGPWPAGEPFHIRHGFVNETGQPLGPGFDIAVYTTRYDGFAGPGETIVHTSDYVVLQETERCGPTYKSQPGPVTCEWFVHEFEEGLPEGRWAIWVVWEAPCWAWQEMGATSSCDDPDEVVSYFSSGFDTPFISAGGPVAFTERDHFGLTSEEIEQELGLAPVPWDEEAVGEMDEPTGPAPDMEPAIDASGVVANFSVGPIDASRAMPGDDGSPPQPLGAINELPGEDRLDFLFEFCVEGGCYRDAHFMDPSNPGYGSGPWLADKPFHIRHGFVNDGSEPLGPGFDVVVYVKKEDAEAASRYTADYVIRGESDQCGPTYKTQDNVETCEWFVHDFPDGLPHGRYDIRVDWLAPCQAWVEMGFTDGCADPDEVMSLFSAGVNSPFEGYGPFYDERNQALD